MTVCSRCGTKGITYGHLGLCANDYAKYRAHQEELHDENLRNRELLAARITHPAGKHPRRIRDWIQLPYEFLGHDESGGKS